jgi:hypothetical protein
VKIASILILNKSESLIGQTVLPVNVGNTEIPNKKRCDLLYEGLSPKNKIIRINNLHGYNVHIDKYSGTLPLILARH